MRYFSLCLSLVVALSSSAQIIKDKEPAILEVHYVKTSVTDTLENRSHSDPMTLRVGNSAMFYPPKRMWVDSLLQTNFELHEKYTEPTEMPVWQILPETKELLGYGCQLATCDFRGRQWYAWFSPDIPINEGPWKLFGLPGLVLEAWDSKKHYAYKAVGLYTKNLQPVGIRLYVRHQPYRLKSRQEFLQKMYKEYILGHFAVSMSALHGNGSQKAPTKAQYDYQERDYRHK